MGCGSSLTNELYIETEDDDGAIRMTIIICGKNMLPQNMISSCERRANDLIKTALIIYTIRRWNPIPMEKAKLAYICFLSPLLLTLALLTRDSISWKYRRFLVNFTYPENRYSKEDVFSTCELRMHPTEESCKEAVKQNFLITVKGILKMYLHLYVIHGIVLYLISTKLHKHINPSVRHKWSLKDVVVTEISNTVRSTAFLAGQTLLQRFFLCAMSKKKLPVKPTTIYATSTLGSLPILFERDFRAQQVNNLVLAHLIIGHMQKKGTLTSQLPMWLFIGTIFKDALTVQTVTLLISIISAFTF